MVDIGQRRRRVWRRPIELLEEPHVKHIVYPCTSRQSLADSDVIDELDDAVGSKVARLELPDDGLRDGRGCPLSKTKEGPIAHLVLHVPMKLVVVLLLDGLCLLQVISDIREELITLLHGLSDHSHARIACLIRSDGRRVVLIDDAKRSVSERHLVW